MIHGALSDMLPLPVTAPGAAVTGTLNSDWVSLKEYQGVVFCVVLSEGRAAAADDVAVAFRQATTAAGGGAKGINPRRAYLREHATDLPSAAAADPTELVDPANVPTNGDMSSIILVEFDAAQLDVNDDFAYVGVRIPGVAGSTREASITAIPYGAFHKLSPEHMRSPLV